MKRSLVLLLVFLATVGISEAIAAQHVAEGHISKHTHGPPRRNIKIIKNGHHNSRNHHLNRLQIKNKN